MKKILKEKEIKKIFEENGYKKFRGRSEEFFYNKLTKNYTHFVEYSKIVDKKWFDEVLSKNEFSISEGLEGYCSKNLFKMTGHIVAKRLNDLLEDDDWVWHNPIYDTRWISISSKEDLELLINKYNDDNYVNKDVMEKYHQQQKVQQI